MGHTPPQVPPKGRVGEQHGHTCVSADSSMLQKMPNCLKFPVLRVRSSMTASRGSTSVSGSRGRSPQPPRFPPALTGGIELAPPQVGGAVSFHLHPQGAAGQGHPHRVCPGPERALGLQVPRLGHGARASAGTGTLGRQGHPGRTDRPSADRGTPGEQRDPGQTGAPRERRPQLEGSGQVSLGGFWAAECRAGPLTDGVRRGTHNTPSEDQTGPQSFC